MKKIVLSLAVLFSMAMVSCGGNKAAETADTDTVVAAVEEVVADSNDDYVNAIACGGSNPTFDAAAKTVTVQPNCMVVVTNRNVSSVKDVTEEAALRVYGEQGTLRVVNAEATVSVYTLEGLRVAEAEGSDLSFNLPAGIYVVRSGNTTAKAIVR